MNVGQVLEFRKGSYGKFGVSPDLACFGKALGNGVPISVI